MWVEIFKLLVIGLFAFIVYHLGDSRETTHQIFRAGVIFIIAVLLFRLARIFEDQVMVRLRSKR
jgi:hypothetical protein